MVQDQVNYTLVTVLIISYNHIDTFSKAIDSVLEQKTNFNYQILVLDDASTDGTAELIKKYENHLNVHILIREKNIGGTLNIFDGLKKVQTKYFAILESDDYWCDDNKLQIQVDILENNLDCSFCAHNTRVDYILNKKSKNFIESITKKFEFPKEISRKHYIEPHTSSRLYRTECLDLEKVQNEIVVTYDIAITFYFLIKGNMYYIDKVMSVYNYTNKGVYSGVSPYMQRFKSAYVVYCLNSEFNFKYNKLLAKFFASKLNLNYFVYLYIKFLKNPVDLKKTFDKILEKYKENYVDNNYDVKPILRIKIPLSKNKKLILELKREKNRI